LIDFPEKKNHKLKKRFFTTRILFKQNLVQTFDRSIDFPEKKNQ